MTDKTWNLAKYVDAIDRATLIEQYGVVSQVVGLIIESEGPGVELGEICHIYPKGAGRPIEAEVVGFRRKQILLMPMGELHGVSPGSLVKPTRRAMRVKVGPDLLGRVFDGLGRPLDGKGSLGGSGYYPIHNEPPNPLSRRRITEPLAVGVKAIDALLSCGKGQRLGIFAGSGVGKSTLLGMMARYTSADVNVIALVGERGREVRDFLEGSLGEEALKRSVVVIATSDQAPLIRLKAAFVATAIAEYFRDQGKDVLFMMDSVTRLATAQREIGLAVGEPPATRGYPPSVFAMLPRLLERTGTGDKGTITGLYTVLVEGDDMNEPIADTVRGILDGHIVLSRKLAEANHYPSIDVLGSVSRVMPEVVSQEHLEAASQIREILAVYRDVEDLINIGAYVPGNNPRVDRAVRHIDDVQAFLRQGMEEHCPWEETIEHLHRLAAAAVIS
ncbi:MAG: flagellar protein export ATPase FliI [Firmicutes bacterium]|nr:flagellar protein export ATPase FliI [Bacillota bacterium]